MRRLMLLVGAVAVAAVLVVAVVAIRYGGSGDGPESETFADGQWTDARGNSCKESLAHFGDHWPNSALDANKLWCPASESQSASEPQPHWVIRDLGTLGGSQSGAAGINASGEIVGWSDTKSGSQHAFLSSDRRMRDLGAFDGHQSAATGINDLGHVVGFDYIDRGGVRIARSFLWREGVRRDLGTFGGTSGMALAINAGDQVVGMRVTKTGWSSAVSWKNGRVTDLGALDSENREAGSSALGIDAKGRVVGWSTTPGTNGTGVSGFLWERGAMTDLGAFGGAYAVSQATAINRRGQIAGSSGSHAVLWQNEAVLREEHWSGGEVTQLGTLGGSSSASVAINQRGQVVGESATRGGEAGESHAFVWWNGAMTDLGALPGGKASAATAINDNSQIVGWATTKDGKKHAVLWTLRSG